MECGEIRRTIFVIACCSRLKPHSFSYHCHQPWHGAIQVPFVDGRKDSSKERNSETFAFNFPYEFGGVIILWLKAVIIMNGEPKEWPFPLPIPIRIKFRYAKTDLIPLVKWMTPTESGPSSPAGSTTILLICFAHSGHRSTLVRWRQATCCGTLTINSRQSSCSILSTRLPLTRRF